ncbi:formyltetrahydrofolate deformylase [Gulosibacter sp. 10]|uniref:formyltetrahydrofolate deformylase n=1 Tax=Gulosibacter sp. 10 TaxID=1255570 RepID=UPI00097E8ED9|nr:formyltetrahydrofolate deformylase [Gulosibacter sp. 10]SJM71446.1 Formyltetrahydrofolate deformylase [Gulosibacter sp. 10]
MTETTSPASESAKSRPNHWVLTLVCADRPGIVHAVTAAIVASAGNVIELQQFSSRDTGRFFLRLEVDTPVTRGALLAELNPVAERFDAEIRLEDATRAIRTLVLGSKAEHCANDLLFRQRAGHLPIEVTRILANHPTLGDLAGFYDVPFEHLPIAGPEDKAAFEDRVRRIIEEEGIELVVLARYMQIVSPELCAELEGRAINIHHSFLPGFKGANPYRQAHERGVKVVGATAHFVTTDLDEGPIIEQNVRRVDHDDTVKELQAMGQDEESRTLTQAVKWFAEHRILLDGQRTIIFK